MRLAFGTIFRSIKTADLERCVTQLQWWGMWTEVEKCHRITLQGSTGRHINPKLHLTGDTFHMLPMMGPVQFLSMRIHRDIPHDTANAKDGLINHLKQVLDNSGIAKLGHTGSRAPAIGGCAPGIVGTLANYWCRKCRCRQWSHVSSKYMKVLNLAAQITNYAVRSGKHTRLTYYNEILYTPQILLHTSLPWVMK